MNYTHPELRRLLTAEYALGTLRGPARRRFERLLDVDAGLRVELVFWETRLAQLGRDLAPVTPDPRVWAAIEQRIGRKAARTRPAHEPHDPWWRSLNLWRGACAFAAAVAVLLAVLLWLLPGAPPARIAAAPPAELVSVIPNKRNQPAWLFIVVRQRGFMSLTAMPGCPEVPRDKDMQLWMLPGPGQPPISIAVMPRSGAITARIPSGAMTALSHAQRLAVSLEPKGGSPTGKPTGPLLFTAPVMANFIQLGQPGDSAAVQGVSGGGQR